MSHYPIILHSALSFMRRTTKCTTQLSIVTSRSHHQVQQVRLCSEVLWLNDLDSRVDFVKDVQHVPRPVTVALTVTTQQEACRFTTGSSLLAMRTVSMFFLICPCAFSPSIPARLGCTAMQSWVWTNLHSFKQKRTTSTERGNEWVEIWIKGVKSAPMTSFLLRLQPHTVHFLIGCKLLNVGMSLHTNFGPSCLLKAQRVGSWMRWKAGRDWVREEDAEDRWDFEQPIHLSSSAHNLLPSL